MKELELTYLDGGYCTHLERMVITDGRLRAVKFPSMFCLIRHPERGNILFDTGYSQRFFEETRRFPEKLYAMVTPAYIDERDVAVAKLRQLGVAPEDVNYVVMSHFHADHIAAIKDFPRARFVYLQSALEHASRLGRVNAVRNGVLLGLLPDDFLRRSEPIQDPQMAIRHDIPLGDAGLRSHDLFGDGSLFAVSLPGHMRGQMGLFLRDGEREHFLIADSCWLSRAYRELLYPSRIAMSIMDDGRVYRETLHQIHRVYEAHPQMHIAPSHCGEVYGAEVALKSSWGERGMNGVLR